MKIRTIAKAVATTVAATLLTVGFVPTSSAQDNALPAGVEVITIVAKRPDPTVAFNCVNDAITAARTSAASNQNSESAVSDRSSNRANFRQAFRHCMQQSTAQI